MKFCFWTKLAIVDGLMISHQNNTTTEACSHISQNIGAMTLTKHSKGTAKLEENAHDGHLHNQEYDSELY
jgi:hypothetical protein